MARERKDRLLVGCLWAVAAAVVLAIGNVWYFLSNFSWTKGRPLRGRSESKPRVSLEKNATREDVAARHWQDMAQEEYESIAAFSELALDLMAAGAPVELVTRCHQAALEEAKHTQTCLDMGLRVNGRTARIEMTSRLRVARGRPRWRAALLARLAVESYVDGWIGEASSARVLAQLARETPDPELGNALRVLAREEMGHARLGEDIVRWATSEGGPLVEHALRIARRRLARSELPPADHLESANLRDLGVPDRELRAAALKAAQAAAP
jgi:hypothetical protein